MNISRLAEQIVAICAGIGIVIGTSKSIVEAVRNMNGWHVLALLSFTILCVVLVDLYRQWLSDKFAKQQLVITDLSRRLREYDTKVSRQLSDLTSAIATDCEQRLKKEIDSRVAGEIADRNRMTDTETRIGKMEGWLKSKNVSL